MRLIIVLLTINFIVMACSDKKLINHDVDPEFKVYVDGFLAETGTQLNGIPVMFDDYYYDMPSDAAGICVTYDNSALPGGSYWQAIVIDRKYWNTINTYQREQLIYHELTHCVLGVSDHRDGLILLGTNFCPISIMGTYAFNTDEIDDCYKPYRSYYITEMRGY